LLGKGMRVSQSITSLKSALSQAQDANRRSSVM